MPVHRCSLDAPGLESCVAEIEAKERIIAVIPHGNAVAIFTYSPSERAKPKGVERR